MLATLKILHFIALLAGGAGGIGNAVLMAHVARSGGPPPPIVREAMAALGRMGLGAIVLLWLTGILMVTLGPGAAAFSWAFWIKLLAALAVLGSVSWLSLLRARAAAAGRPPDPARMRPLARIALAGSALAIVFAVLAFG